MGKSGSACHSEFGGDAAAAVANVSDVPLLQQRLRGIPCPVDRPSAVQAVQGDLFSVATRANECVSSGPAGAVGTPGSVSLSLSSSSPVPSSRGSMEFTGLGASGEAASGAACGNRGWTQSFHRKNTVDVLQESAGLRTPAAVPCEELRAAERKALLNLAVNSGATNGSGAPSGGALWCFKGEGLSTTGVPAGLKGEQQVTARVPGAFAVLPTSTPPTVTPTSSGVYRNGGPPQAKKMMTDSPLEEKPQRRNAEQQRHQEALDLLQLLGAGLDSSMKADSRGPRNVSPDDGLLRLLRDAAAADRNEDPVSMGPEKRHQPIEIRDGCCDLQRNQSSETVEHKDESKGSWASRGLVQIAKLNHVLVQKHY